MCLFSSTSSLPPLHPFLSLHPFVWCSLWHLGHARLWGREGGTGHAIVPGRTHGISIVFFLSRSAERWPVTFRIWWCQAPSFFGPFIWFFFFSPPSSSLHSNAVLGPQHKRQYRIVCAAWLIRALHQLGLTSTSCAPTSPQSLMRKYSIYKCPPWASVWEGITCQCLQKLFPLAIAKKKNGSFVWLSCG